MRWIVSILYVLAGFVAAPFLVLRYVRTGKGVAELRTKLTGRVASPPRGRDVVWIHAVSVGEVLQVRPLVDALRRREAGCVIVLSVTTGSGLRVARERFADCHVIPFPFDFAWSVRTAFRRVRPTRVVLIELELWPNFLAEARRQDVPVSVVSGRLSESSFCGYDRAKWVVAPMLRSLDAIATQTETYRQRFIELGASPGRVQTTGCLKHDNLLFDAERSGVDALRTRFAIAPDEMVIVAGSTHDPEEIAAIDAYRQLRARGYAIRLIIAPRHPERFDPVAEKIIDAGEVVCRYSDGPIEGCPVGLLDTVGQLATCWHLADIAFVGGSLTPRGGQNMLEPAAAGAAVIFGPNVWNFKAEVDGLRRTDAAIQIGSSNDLANGIATLLDDPERRRQLQRNARGFAASLGGCSEHAAAMLMPSPQRNRAAA